MRTEWFRRAGWPQSSKVMPQIDTDALAGKGESGEGVSLFTVDDLVDMVALKAAAAG